MPCPEPDRTIKVVEIGGEHYSVGTIHRGPTNLPGGAGRAAGWRPAGAGRRWRGGCGGRGAWTRGSGTSHAVRPNRRGSGVRRRHRHDCA